MSSPASDNLSPDAPQPPGGVSAVPARPRRRWLQYSLRSLFVFMTLCAVLTWWGTVWYRQITDEEEAIAELRNIGVDVTLFVPNSKEAATITSGPPQWFRNLVGKKDFLHASEVEFGIEHTYIVEKQQPGDVPNIEYGPYHKNCNIAIDLS